MKCEELHKLKDRFRQACLNPKYVGDYRRAWSEIKFHRSFCPTCLGENHEV